MTESSTIELLLLDVDGTMTDGGIYVMEDGKQFKKFNAHDGQGIRMALDAGVHVGIISHSLEPSMVEHRAKMLGIKHCYIGQEPKISIYRKWLKDLNLGAAATAFIGDDINDLEIMQAVRISACPADAMDEVKEIADILLSKNGGKGCIREFVDKHLLANKF